MGSPSYRSITGTLTYDPSSGQSCSLPGRISALIRAFLGRDNVRRKQQVSRSPSPRCPGSSAAFQGLGGAGLPPCLAGTLRSQGRLGKAAKLRGVRVNVLSLFSQTRQRFFCIFLSEKRPKPNKRGKKKISLEHVSATVRFTNRGQEIALIYLTLPSRHVPRMLGRDNLKGGSGLRLEGTALASGRRRPQHRLARGLQPRAGGARASATSGSASLSLPSEP